MPVISITVFSVNHSKCIAFAGIITKLPGPYTFATALESGLSFNTRLNEPEITVMFKSPWCLCGFDLYPGGKKARSTNNPGISLRLTKKIFLLPDDSNVSVETGIIISAERIGFISILFSDFFCLQETINDPATTIIGKN